MGISFGNPLFAWGALLAAVPILIHLLQRRRPRPHPFAAMELVIRSQRQNVRRLRLKRLLLLCARVSLLLFLPLALAKPHVSQGAGVAAAPKGPAATAIVVDASMSMQWKDGKTPLLDRAKEDARRVLADLLSEEPVTVLRCDGGTVEAEAPTFDRGQMRRLIDETEASYLPADLTACVHAAATALGESPLAAKRIFVATDLTASGWRLDGEPPVVPTEAGDVRPEVVILDAARGKELPNLAVTDLRIEPAPEIGGRGRAFTFTVRNFGTDDVGDLPTELEVEGEVVAKSFLDVPAGGVATKRLLHRFPAGGTFTGAVRIEGDALSADDVRAFVTHVPKDIRLLLVNGAPSSVRYRDEAFFVDTALRAGGTAPIELRTIDGDRLAQQSLEGWDVIFLLNLRAPGPEVAAKLRAFVEAGGGLFLSLGDQVDGDAYNQALGALLPLPLHLAKTAAEAGEEARKGASFGDLDLGHPVLRIFSGAGLEGFSAVRTSRYFLLQPGEAQILATFDDGAPAWVERRLGKGIVSLFTSTVDRDWSDWAIQASFLPAMQQLAAHLSSDLHDRAELRPLLVGERRPLPLPRGATILGPDGKEVRTIGEDAGVVVEAARPGIHRVDTDAARTDEQAAGGEELLAFAAVVAPEESDTRRLEPEELLVWLGDGTAEVEQRPAERRRRETPLWSLLLAVGVLAFFLEGTLIRK